MEINKLTLTQIGLYNTQRVTDEQSIQLFSARKKQFQILMDAIDRTHADNAPQHQLIIAQRGMGKTTLLKRIEVELRSEPWCNRFIPLLFPEEQYNVKDLSEFWLNCIDALADVIELEHQKELVSEIDQTVEKLMEITNDNQRANEAHTYLINISKRLKRRPVLLIDNLNLIFDRMNEKEQHTMRSLMSKDGAPIIIGASSVIIEDTINYKAPFYDAFRIHHLEKLTINELTDILVNLADITHDPHIISTIENHAARIKALYKLTGGNPRTAVMLFRLVVKGFSSDINDDLEALLDEATPIYKARFEELSDQMQIVIDAIAMNWEPITLEQLRVATRYENGQLSPQLKRLADTGWIEKPANRQGKGGAYEISERIFNIWFLMRRSSRRQKKNVFCLSKFMEAYYGEEIENIAERCLKSPFTCTKQVIEALAVAKLTSDQYISEQLCMKSREFIFDHSQKQPELLDTFDQNDLYGEVTSITEDLKNKLDQKKWREASILFKILIDKAKDPKQKGNLYRLAGENYINLKDYISAENYLKQSLELDKYNDKTYYDLASIYHDCKKDYSEAEKLCQTAMNIAPGNPMGAFLLGKLYHKDLGDFQVAEQMYLKAIELCPRKTKYHNALANMYQDTKDLEKAVNIYLETLQLDPENEEALFKLAYIYYEIENENEAIKYYNRVIKLFPKNDKAHFNLALIYIHRKEYLKSERLFKKILKINPENSSAYYQLGTLADKAENYEKAISYYKKSIALNPENSNAYISLSVLYFFEMNNHLESEKLLKKVIEKDSQNTKALFLLGLIDEVKGQNDTAIEYYHKILNVKPQSTVYTRLANIYEEKQEFTKAEKYYTKAIALKPENGNIWKQLGDLYQFVLKNYSKADETYLNGMKTKAHKLFKYSLIHLYRDKMNQTEKAMELFTTLKKEDTSDYLYDLNRILFELHSKNEGNAAQSLSNILKDSDANRAIKQLDHWIYFAAQVLNLGYSGFLLNCLMQNDYHISMAPYYHAIKAASEKEPLIYLDSIPMEIRELAVDIMNKIKKYR